MARDFVDVMKEALNKVTPGLQRMGREIDAELVRLGKQGSLEMAQAIFNEAAFTPYGPGQYTPTPDLNKDGKEAGGQDVKQQAEQEREQSGREM